MSLATRNDYDAVSQCYEALAHLYSLGRILACKRSQMEAILPGDRVLITGAGGGEDALLAAGRGARVTAIDLSGGMVARALGRVRSRGMEGAVELIQGDILDHARLGHYDVVVSNFFLNVFPEPVMEEVLGHLIRLLRPGGRLLIADFAPATGPFPGRFLRRLYFGLAVLAFRLAARNALHPLYDYTTLFQARGLTLEEDRGFRLPIGGPVLFRTLASTRRAHGAGDAHPDDAHPDDAHPDDARPVSVGLELSHGQGQASGPSMLVQEDGAARPHHQVHGARGDA